MFPDEAVYKKLKLKGARDIWFVGITPEEITVVWFYHEKGVPFPGSGSSMAASTWAHYAQNAIHPSDEKFYKTPDEKPKGLIEFQKVFFCKGCTSTLKSHIACYAT